MCDFCSGEKQLLSREIPTELWGQLTGEEEIQVIIDRGYLRMGFTDDIQCMDHGQKIKINFCLICGEKL